MTPYKAIQEFHDKFSKVGLRHLAWEKLDDPVQAEGAALRFLLIKEEFKEFIDAIKASETDIANKEKQAAVLKELCDVVYVLYGFAEKFGWDADEAFARVHASNMSKVGPDGEPVYREDGKLLKGPNYKPPYLLDLVGYVEKKEEENVPT